MAWILNGIRIYASKDETKLGQNIARLEPLNGSTILHIFGNNAKIKSFGGLVVTNADLTSLEGLINTGLSYTLSGPEGSLGDYYVKDISSSRTDITNVCLFDRPSLPTDSPVYDVEVELYIDS